MTTPTHKTLPPRLHALLSASTFMIASPWMLAASDTWSGATDGNWSDTSNWVGGVAPGATSGTTNADTATFNDAGSGNTTITVDAGRNLKFITIDTASAGSYTIGSSGANGGETLNLTSGGKILINSTVADGVTQTFNAPIALNGSYTFDNQSTGTATFIFAGNITANSNSTLTVLTNNAAAGTGINVFSGNMSNGSGTLSVLIGQFSSGTGTGKVEFTGNNTYSGTTTVDFAQGKPVGTGEFIASGTNSSSGITNVQHGTLTLNNASNGGIAGGLLQLGGGGFLRANTAAAGTLGNDVRHDNTFTLTGANDITINGTFTNNTASNRPLNNLLDSGKKLTLNGDVYLSTASGTARTWQLRGSGETIINGDIMDFSGGKGTAASSIDFSTTSGGARSLTLAGNNTYSGNTVLGGGASTVFTLAEGGSMTFYIGANGINNQVNGSATANFDGSFAFDLSGADLTDGNNWLIVDVGTLTESFSGTFVVTGFSESANVWTDGTGFSFDEATGILSYTAVPEPASAVLLAGLGTLGFAALRRRRTG